MYVSCRAVTLATEDSVTVIVLFSVYHCTLEKLQAITCWFLILLPLAL